MRTSARSEIEHGSPSGCLLIQMRGLSTTYLLGDCSYSGADSAARFNVSRVLEPDRPMTYLQGECVYRRAAKRAEMKCRSSGCSQ